MVHRRCISSWPRVRGGKVPRNGDGTNPGGGRVFTGMAHCGTGMRKPSTPNGGCCGGGSIPLGVNGEKF